MSNSKKLNLRDRLEDNTLDLSMSEIEEVPVKEIALIKKATDLDLSINKIFKLEENFAILLTHLTKLDLGKNLLTSLPNNFGNLTHLKHLDLYNNKLVHLPLSFGKLKSLRWLDLKGNPLLPALLDIAGPCFDQQQCQQCAKKVVVFLEGMNKQVEHKKYENAVEEERKRKEQEASQKLEPLKDEVKRKKKIVKGKDKKKENGMKPAKIPVAEKLNKPMKKSEVSKIKATSKKQTGGSFFGSLLKYTFMLGIMTAISLMLLNVLDQEKYLQLVESSKELWKQAVVRLPPQVIEAGNRAAEVVKLAWSELCMYGKQGALQLHKAWIWISTHENSQFIFIPAASFWETFYARTSQFYSTIIKEAPIYYQEIKNKII